MAAARRDLAQRRAADHLPALDVAVAEVDGRIAGFSGLTDGKLEMLFVDAGLRGGGVGGALLHLAADGAEFAVRRALDSDAAAVADVWLRSFTKALPGVRRAHTDDEVRDWIRAVVVPAEETWVATAAGDAVVAMMVLDGADLDQLYVDLSWQGRGLGGRLLDLAKRRRPDGLELWTFQVNERALRFYERHGFVAVESTDGRRNEEGEPDVRYVWRPGNPVS